MFDSLAELNNRIREVSSWVSLLRDEMGRVIVGQRYMVDRMIVGLLANGHILLEGVPGLAESDQSRKDLSVIGSAGGLFFNEAQH
jgi:MoxR-like ATPase